MQFSNHHFQGPFPKHNLSTRRKQTYLLKIDGWKTMSPFSGHMRFLFYFLWGGGGGKSFEISRWFKVIKLYPLIGGHLPFEGSLSHLKRGHRELPVARMRFFLLHIWYFYLIVAKMILFTFSRVSEASLKNQVIFFETQLYPMLYRNSKANTLIVKSRDLWMESIGKMFWYLFHGFLTIKVLFVVNHPLNILLDKNETLNSNQWWSIDDLLSRQTLFEKKHYNIPR